ncbi:MAG TPA: cell division protein FtsA [Spirochaetota bacterium]|nr:cell division protein FtsA [Spirochaetota bacterium]HOM86966.1 cell division protein FtsA [Spirochaetota bacterium]HOR93063.1 cell division protein FtsA [Spirochaetota bacterium]HPD04498.1 cell division protein FtsA [Spirochaetota bacterium]HPK43676.1 cell division protein FtsA [Spirochaetota bacterium]
MKEDTIMENIVVGLDIGTTKTCAVIGFLNENKQIEVVGVGVAPSKGLKSGVIVNIDNTVASIIKAIDDAELMGGCEVNSVFVGITGQHIKGENSRGVVAVANRNRTITPVEMKRVIEAAQAIVIPMDREIIHVLSKEFAVDDQTGIKDPIGMSGVRLEAEVHIITGSTTSIQNLVKSVNKAGFVCNDIVFSPLASAESTLSRDEKDLGVALVDIGGGTTDIMVFIEGGVAYSAVLGIGGIHVTNDISIGLRTPIDSAEVIKKKYGCAVVDLVDASETIEVPSVGGRAPRRLFRHELAQIIEPRVIEIMEMIDNELVKSGKKEILAAGVVLTGGGSMIEGTVDAAERVLNMPVRVGFPENIVGLKDVVSTPMYANGVGLLRYGAKMGQLRQTRKTPGGLKSLKDKLRQIFNDYL